MEIRNLSNDQCILLTVHYASQANIQALHSFTPARLDALDPALVLRIVLTYLSEAVDPKVYTTYIREVASRLYLDIEREDIEVDISPVKDISQEEARSRVQSLQLLEINPPRFPAYAPRDILTGFICHRSYLIEEKTGNLEFVAQLARPFLDRNEFIKTWYISVVLPVLRLNTEYYPGKDGHLKLKDFEQLEGENGVDCLLRNTQSAPDADVTLKDGTHIGVLTRDIKGLVGPWMYGHLDREQRHSVKLEPLDGQVDHLSVRMRKVSLSGVSEADKTGHDWEYVYSWVVHCAEARFPLVTQLVDEWEGPADLDLDGLATTNRYIDQDTLQKLEAQYAQVAFASCYAAQADSDATIKGAHGVLARLAELLDFIPPPDLATSVDSLPEVEEHTLSLDRSNNIEDLAPASLLRPEHPLTTPRIETYMLLQMLVYSAYQLSGLNHRMSIVNVAKLQFYSTSEDQLAFLKELLNDITGAGRRDDAQWTHDRAKLLWLWSWGIKSKDKESATGAGVLGKISRADFEAELLKALVGTSCFKLASSLTMSGDSILSQEQVEGVVYSKIMEAYDSASNGNKTRGGIKRANDILMGFRKQFPQSQRLAEAAALIAATHALSFYSLTLQHGVPFKPVNIRASRDPIELINKVLEQNTRSFAQLDDLIGVAQNLVLAGFVSGDGEDEATGDERSSAQISRQQQDVGRRVTFMAVEAALREDDFETAYSYIVSRLTPSSLAEAKPRQHSRGASDHSVASRAAKNEDDISWRAAYLAGRYRPSRSSPPSLRWLEQRKELLSLALLLAPTHALTDILSSWRRCEEELSTMQAAQQAEEQDFDDKADRREPSTLPGHFALSDQPELVLNQKRREVGRMTAARSGGDNEAPLSMFDLTRNAARALSRNVDLGHAHDRVAEGSRENSMDLQRSSNAEDGEQRVRRRDMVANAVSGGLANGIGWVLGAKPVAQ